MEVHHAPGLFRIDEDAPGTGGIADGKLGMFFQISDQVPAGGFFDLQAADIGQAVIVGVKGLFATMSSGKFKV